MKAILNIASANLVKNTLAKAVIAGSVILTGCASSSLSSLAINTAPVTNYLVNKDTGAFCRAYADKDVKGQCRSLVVVSTSILESRVIENIYQQQIIAPNRAASVIDIILHGDNRDYQAQRLDNGLYTVPSNQQTDTVWRTLIKIENNVYSET